MGAESVENCVDSSETAKDDTNETETELLKLKADILLLTEKLKTANTKIEQYEQTIRANKLSANDVIN